MLTRLRESVQIEQIRASLEASFHVSSATELFKAQSSSCSVNSPVPPGWGKEVGELQNTLRERFPTPFTSRLFSEDLG